MVGADHAGIAETIQFMLTKFTEDEQQRLCQVGLSQSSLHHLHHTRAPGPNFDESRLYQ